MSIVYIIRAGDDETSPVKIGFHEGVSPAQRMASLQTGNARPFRILATLSASTIADEHAVHRALQHIRVPGSREWYFPTALLVRCIKATKGKKCSTSEFIGMYRAGKV